MTTTPMLDPLLKAHLDKLAEVAPGWTETDRELWCSLFVATISLLYPTRKRRKPRKAAK